MGYLWENMEKIDVQGTYDALMEARAELEEAKAIADNAVERATVAEKRAQISESELADAKAIANNAVERANVAEKRAQISESELARLKALLEAHGISDTEQ